MTATRLTLGESFGAACLLGALVVAIVVVVVTMMTRGRTCADRGGALVQAVDGREVCVTRLLK